MQVKNLQLETQHNSKWESIQRNGLLRQKQGRERVWLSAASEGERSKEAVKSFIQGSSSGSLSFFSPIIWFLFPHLTYPGTLPWVHTHPSAKMDLKVKASGRSKTHYGLALSRVLTHRKPFCACVVSPLFQKSGRQRSLDPLLIQAFAPSLSLP